MKIKAREAGDILCRPLSGLDLFVDDRAKPDGVQGCEVWVKVDGPPPADPSELKYLATDTRTPLPGGVRRQPGGQDCLLHAALGEHARRNRPLESDGQRHDY